MSQVQARLALTTLTRLQAEHADGDLIDLHLATNARKVVEAMLHDPAGLPGRVAHGLGRVLGRIEEATGEDFGA